jgi:hypothetical protein
MIVDAEILRFVCHACIGDTCLKTEIKARRKAQNLPASESQSAIFWKAERSRSEMLTLRAIARRTRQSGW